MQPDVAPGQKVAPAPPETKEEIRSMITTASANPADLQFPTDTWGFTSDIKKAVLRAASTIRGQDDKHNLMLQTLSVLAAHIVARKPKDAEFAQKRTDRKKASADERAPRQRVSASVVAKAPN